MRRRRDRKLKHRGRKLLQLELPQLELLQLELLQLELLHLDVPHLHLREAVWTSERLLQRQRRAVKDERQQLLQARVLQLQLQSVLRLHQPGCMLALTECGHVVCCQELQHAEA